MEYSNDSERIEELLESKSFSALSEEEKAMVIQELGSEQEYTRLRKISVALVSKTDLSPDPRTLLRLHQALADTHRMSWLQQIIGYRVPAWSLVPAVASLMILFSVFTNEDETKENVFITVTDTVFVKSAPDTVFLERAIVRYRQAKPARVSDYSIVRNIGEKNSGSEGVNMKEKEELEPFLVSGS